jgi:hypothetical protein
MRTCEEHTYICSWTKEALSLLSLIRIGDFVLAGDDPASGGTG